MNYFKILFTGLLLCSLAETPMTQSLSNYALASFHMSAAEEANPIDLNESIEPVSIGNSFSFRTEDLFADFVWGRDDKNIQMDIIESYGYDLSQLNHLSRAYQDDPYFFDRYFHPEAQYLTGYHLGRAGMPIIEIVQQDNNQMRVEISCRTEKAKIFYTVNEGVPDENSQLYEGPLTLPASSVVHVKCIRLDLEHSVVGLIQSGVISQKPAQEELDEDKIMGIFSIPDTDEAIIKFKTKQEGSISVSVIDTYRQVHDIDEIYTSGPNFGHFRLNTAIIPEGPYLVKFKFESGRTTYRQVTR